MNRVTCRSGIRIQPQPQPRTAQMPPLATLSTSPVHRMNSSSQGHRGNSSSTAQRDSQTLKLPDGRVLGFAEYGSPTGKPVFFFHGFPSSRLEAEGILKLAYRPDLRIIAPERPGFGLSTFNPHHRITDYPADVHALATHLGLPRFAILGGSGGAPYALACARALPAEMMSAVGLLAPAAPWREGGIGGVPYSSRITALAAYYWPSALTAISAGVVGLCRWLATTGFVARRIDSWLEAMRVKDADLPASPTSASTSPSSANPSIPSTSPSPPLISSPPTTKSADRKKSTQETREALLRTIFETFRQGTAPMVRESQLLTWEGWGFPLNEVRHDNILIWHGVEDGQSPIAMVRDLARQLPQCELREFEGETHFTLARKQLGALLEQLIPIEGKPQRGEEANGGMMMRCKM
ncbi:Alpha/Beta hydrolase protein [Xylaria arbuscula]|nr:Alpha/Beta hydrolase protein [Xylaria arbuscula]